MTTDLTASQGAAAAPALTRAERNRRNAQKSTGPRTAEGKYRSRLNAFEHGGTAHLVLMPGDDAAAFGLFSAGQMAALAPQGADETSFAQAIIDARWQMSRTQAYENNLLFLLPSGSERGGQRHHPSPVETAESAALTFFHNLHKFDLIGRYIARLNRLIIQNHDKLTDLQSARRSEAQREKPLGAGPLRKVPPVNGPLSELERQAARFDLEMEDLYSRLEPPVPGIPGAASAQSNQQPATNSGFVSSTLGATRR